MATPPPPSSPPEPSPAPPKPPKPTPRLSFPKRIAASPAFRTSARIWGWRNGIVFGAVLTYGLVNWQINKANARKRDFIKDKTYLLWKIYDGGIVEAKTTGSSLNYLLTSSGGSPDEPPRVMTLFEVIRTIKFIQADDRIRGIIADFSATSVPAVPPYSLGLAQIEEIQDAMLELRKTKVEKFGSGPDGWRTIAWTDTFGSQGRYLLASTFDEVYTQPTGEVPLVGMGSTVPFYGRLAKWLGIEVQAEARSEYKSFVQPYIAEAFSKPQKDNQMELLNDLNDNYMSYIARNRFPLEAGQAGLDKVKKLSQTGPYTSREAVAAGLLDGATYRQDVLDSVLAEDAGGDPEVDVKGFYHYAKVMEKVNEKAKLPAMEVGVVYLLGAIGEQGEFGTAAVVKGLKEAGEDDTIGAVVLRVDSGGGGVIESDTIWAAMRELREKYGKTVVASFANASASGGYLVSTHADAIFAAPSTVTGSIGVAALRPTFLQKFFDRFHVTLDSYFTGSKVHDLTQTLQGDDLKRHQEHVDQMYEDFKGRVCEGRQIDARVIDLIAGGRVMTGLTAFGLTAPPELIASIKGLGALPSTEPTATIEEVDAGTPAGIIETVVETPLETPLASEDSKIDEVVNKMMVAVIDEDQETSPFAGTSGLAASPTPSHFEPVSTPDEAEDNAALALASSTPEEAEDPPKDFKLAKDGVYEIAIGPLGRGLVDGLGGLRDAAIFASELFISKEIANYLEENPGTNQDDAAKAIMPQAALGQGPDGETLLMMDVRIKRFPVHKGFWDKAKEVARQGDAIERVSIGELFKMTAAALVMRMVSGALMSELEDLGMGDVRGGLGLGRTSRNRITAEWGGMNLR